MPSATSRGVKTGEDPRPGSDEVHRLWFHRQEECIEALRIGEAVEVVPTAYPNFRRQTYQI